MTTLCVLVASSLSAWHRFKYMHSAERAAKLAAPCIWASCGTNSPHRCFCSTVILLTVTLPVCAMECTERDVNKTLSKAASVNRFRFCSEHYKGNTTNCNTLVKAWNQT